jgi:hypothetical protein
MIMGGIAITALAGRASVRSCFIILLGIPHYQPLNKLRFSQFALLLRVQGSDGSGARCLRSPEWTW